MQGLRSLRLSVNQHMKLSTGLSSEPPISALVQQPSQHHCRVIPAQDGWNNTYLLGVTNGVGMTQMRYKDRHRGGGTTGNLPVDQVFHSGGQSPTAKS